MNIVEALADWLAGSYSDLTLGQNLFIAKLPVNAPDTVWWLKLSSPSTGVKAVTGELSRPTTVDVYVRSRDPQYVYDRLPQLDQLVNSEAISLSGFEITEVDTAGPFSDQDLDDTDREVGLLQVTLTTYKENA